MRIGDERTLGPARAEKSIRLDFRLWLVGRPILFGVGPSALKALKQELQKQQLRATPLVEAKKVYAYGLQVSAKMG